MPEDDSEGLKWKKRYEREKNARQQAEKLLEDKSSQLYIANQKLEQKILLESSKFRREEEKFTALFHYSQDGIILHTEAGKIIDANQRICDLLGAVREEIIDQHISTIHPEDSQILCKKALSEIASEGHTRFECHIINNARQMIPVEIAATRFQVGEQSIIQGIIRDITVNKKAAKELKIATNAAIKANNAKSLFLATMSHEIRTPLNGVIGFTDLLLQSNVSEEQRQHLTLIKKSGDLLLNIINDILDFSRIESGQIELENVDFSLTESIEDALEIHAQTASNKEVDLVYYIDPNIPEYLHGDAGRLKQILLNLVSNGLKFTEHGSVSIKAERVNQSHLQITIADTGIGFNEEIKDQLFQPFKQADASTTRKYGGTGLGLAICKQLAEAMGGSISVVSKVGEGAEFTITLPYSPAQKQKSSETSSVTSLEGLKVLILDDNAINLEFMEARLSRWRCQVTVVASPHEALDILQSSNDTFDLLLIDMLMPEMDGFQFARALSNISIEKRSPMILITSSREVRKSSALDAGFVDVLHKPVREKMLLHSIFSTVHEQEAREASKSNQTKASQASPKLEKFALIVEDNHINAKLAKLLVERLGLIVHIAHNGEEALEALKVKSMYDVIFMDMQMPVMDGLEATKQIRNGESFIKYREVPVIAMTANVLPEDEAKCIAAGMNDYITKPIEVKKVKDCLQKYGIL